MNKVRHPKDLDNIPYHIFKHGVCIYCNNTRDEILDYMDPLGTTLSLTHEYEEVFGMTDNCVKCGTHINAHNLKTISDGDGHTFYTVNYETSGCEFFQ